MIVELADANMHADLAKAREEMTERALKFLQRLIIGVYSKILKPKSSHILHHIYWKNSVGLHEH